MQSFASAMTNLRKALLAALRSFFKGRSFLQALFAFWISPATLRGSSVDFKTALPAGTIDDFLKEAEQRFLGPIQGDRLRWFSDGLKLQFRDRLQSHAECMLPSFNHLLPSGDEKGRYLALDVGGSTLRVALVALRGREATGREGEIICLNSFKITPDIKKLEGMAFFDWMAQRIEEVIRDDVPQDSPEPVPMGLAWSFPVECVLPSPPRRRNLSAWHVCN